MDDIIKIVQVKSRDRIVLPKEVMKILQVHEGDFVAFIKHPPGVKIQKAILSITEE